MNNKLVSPRLLPVKTDAKDSLVAVNWQIHSKPKPRVVVAMIESRQYPLSCQAGDSDANSLAAKRSIEIE